jgi:hypothetical protein
VINFGAQNADVQVKLPEQFAGLAGHETLPDLLSGSARRTAGEGDSLKVSLKAGESALLSTPAREQMEWNVR